MRTVNKVTLLGCLGKDAETKCTPSGASVTNFTLATNRRWKDKQADEWKEETDWHRIVLWRNENLAPHLLKGKQVYIEGRLQTRSYEDKEGQKRSVTEIVAEEVILLGGDRSSDRKPEPHTVPQPVRSAKPAQPDGAGFGVSDDDVPFGRYDPPCL
jgi:single-strand DNA-binding protein